MRFGPDLGGPLLLLGRNGNYTAEIAGRQATAKIAGAAVSFTLPDEAGSFAGRFDTGRARLRGHWVQPGNDGNPTTYASPVTLVREAPERWAGQVTPLTAAITLYLVVEPRRDGSLGAFIRNPEANVGRFFAIERVEQRGEAVRLLGAGAAVLGEGRYRDGMLALSLNGISFDFHRVGPGEASDFYPRGHASVPYHYAPPPARPDGWPVDTLEAVHIDRARISNFIQSIIDMPMDSIHAHEVHGVLVARHGKLVLEEYFHGEHRDKPHDTRSASKSLLSTLVAAAMAARLPIALDTPVYRAMNGGVFPPGLEAHKRALTVEHLLTMSSGLDCDNRDPRSRGNEDVMWQQRAQPDFYRYTLDLASLRAPGKEAIYCSASPNLAGGVLARATGRPLSELVQELFADPLHIERYWLNLMPNGEAYMGGGIRFLPRDFMKLGQLFANGGTWNGHRVVSEEWTRRAGRPLYPLDNIHYGYGWWEIEYPYHGRTIQAYFAGGNGGQLVMVIPALDVVVACFGGNYSDPVFYEVQRQWVPRYLLPAIADER